MGQQYIPLTFPGVYQRVLVICKSASDILFAAIRSSELHSLAGSKGDKSALAC